MTPFVSSLSCLHQGSIKSGSNFIRDQGPRFGGQTQRNKVEGASEHSLEVKEEEEVRTYRARRKI